MFFGDFVDDSGKIVDEIVLLNFPAPHSLTGEHVIEIQCHGSLVVVERIEKILERIGVRRAERGEFSYRSLVNGKTTPEKLEELADLFLAREPATLDAIYSRRERTLAREIAKIRESMVRLQAILDTAVDFSDEYSSVVGAAIPLSRSILENIQLITHRYSSFRSGSAFRRLVLAGRPNAGKSSLFNGIVGHYRAIVHEKPGTTRDVIEEDLEIDGHRWKLVDTAGFREIGGQIEAEGMARGREYLASASVWALVVDGVVGLAKEDRALLSELRGRPHVVIWNKSDLPEWQKPPADVPTVPCSTLTAGGMASALDHIRTLTAASGDGGAIALPSAQEHARLRFLEGGLLEVAQSLEQNTPPEFVAEKVRSLTANLEKTLGGISREDVLDRIFGEFCIGK